MKEMIRTLLIGFLVFPSAILAQEVWITIGNDGYQTLKKIRR